MVKKGRYWVVCMHRGMQFNWVIEAIEDIQVFRWGWQPDLKICYWGWCKPCNAIFPSLDCGQDKEWWERIWPMSILRARRRRPSHFGHHFSNYGQVGHNICTCPLLHNKLVDNGVPQVLEGIVEVEGAAIQVEPSSIQPISQLVTQGALVAPSIEERARKLRTRAGTWWGLRRASQRLECNNKLWILHQYNCNWVGSVIWGISTTIVLFYVVLSSEIE